MDLNTGKGLLNEQMVVCTKENSLKMLCRGKEFIIGKMEGSIKGNGFKVNYMGREF
jgi:hypothetical protein